jgi:hypothetical protein
MQTITTIGLDVAMSVAHIHGTDVPVEEPSTASTTEVAS